MTKVFVYYIIYICNTIKQSLKKHIKVTEKVVKKVQWINQRKGVLNHIVPKEDNKDFLEEAEKEKKELEDSMVESFRQRDERIRAEHIRNLEAEVGNLKVQNADYSQIVGELSDKLKKYENKYGTVFTKGSSNKTE